MKLNTLIAPAIAVLFVLSDNTLADAEYQEPAWEKLSVSEIAPVDNDTYKKACGSCHDAYSPGLLSPQSWEKIISGLDQHFDKVVKLERSEKKEIFNYLLNGAAGRSKYVLSSRLLEGLQSPHPLRITVLPYFVKHHSSSDGYLGQCSRCHTQTEKGSYAKEEIALPQAPTKPEK